MTYPLQSDLQTIKMKTVIVEVKNAIVLTVITAIVCCGLYPLAIYGIGQAGFSHQANGSLIQGKDGKILGSELLGQSFTSDKYFHPRPSAAGAGYDASNSSGTNLGPTSQKLMDSVKAAVAQYRKENSLPPDALVPCDAVTSSASGLDPHISPKNALLQAARVAKARSLSEDKVREAIAKYTDGPDWGVFGDPGVNVVKLNLALDGQL